MPLTLEQNNDPKTIFIVSNHRSHTIVPGSRGFIAEPFLSHIFDRDGITQRFSSLHTAPFLRHNKEGIQEALAFVTNRNERYLSILSERLNAVHGLSGSLTFWRKAFGLALVRHITILHDFFNICEAFFEPGEHTAEILAQSGYHIPLDYDEQRWFIQQQHYGQEQLLSLYLRTFHPGIGTPYEDHYSYEYRISQPGVYHHSQPRIGIMCAFFAPQYLSELQQRSGYQIDRVGFNRNFQIYDRLLNPEARKFLSQLPPQADRFDKFFFSTLPELFPRVFVEYFLPVAANINYQLNTYRNLEYVVSEMWLSETYECIALALLSERGVKHIYNEHNYNEHPYHSTQQHLQASVPDIFLAHGSYDVPLKNLVKASSLFEFIPESPLNTKLYPVLYVSGVGLAKYSNYSHAFMDSSEHVPRYYRFKRAFFAALNPKVKASMLYRGYPRDDFARMWDMCWDDRYLMNDLLHGVSIDDWRYSCKQMMSAAQLVVIDYFSTTHLESFSMNVPTVLFIRRDSMFLSEAHKDFVSELLECGICQDDPVKAAQFVTTIIDDPIAWWMSSKVQAARTSFLKKNLGAPAEAIAYYLSLLSRNEVSE